jgi:hypothetical protein
MAITKAYEIGEFGINLVVDSAGNVSSLAIDTTDVPEGTRLYYTDARARAAISVSGNLTYDSGTGVLGFTMPTTIASLSNHDTDDLAEGSGNLYFTSARARSSLTGSNGITYTSSTGDFELTDSGVTADTYGSASQVPVITVDAKGRVTSASTTAVAGVSSTAYNSSTGVLTINTSDGGSFTNDLGIGSSDSPTFAGLTTTGNISVNNADGFVYLSNAGVGNAGIYVRGRNATNTLRSHSTGDHRWEITGTEYMVLGTSGLSVTGNISVSGTVDGRDIAADGTKLDGIEVGATADQTKADIDALNIDADTLDGQHGSYYTGYTDTAIANLIDSSPSTLDTLNELAAALGDDPNFATTVSTQIGTKLNSSSYTAADVLAKIKTVDGSGSGLDADTLDGLDSTQFLRSDTSDTMAGTLNLNGSFQQYSAAAPSSGNAYFSTNAYGVSQGDGRTHFGYNSNGTYLNYIRGSATYIDGALRANDLNIPVSQGATKKILWTGGDSAYYPQILARADGATGNRGISFKMYNNLGTATTEVGYYNGSLVGGTDILEPTHVHNFYISAGTGESYVSGNFNFKGDIIILPDGTADPTVTQPGSAYYNTNSSKLKVFDGSEWGEVSFRPPFNLTNYANCVGWWKIDELSNVSTLTDFSGSGHNFSPLSGTASFENFPNGTQGIRIGVGSGTYYIPGYNFVTGSGARTYAMVAYNLQDNGGLQHLYHHGTATTNQSFGLAHINSVYEHHTWGGSGTTIALSNNPLNVTGANGVAVFFAGYDGSNGFIKVYGSGNSWAGALATSSFSTSTGTAYALQLGERINSGEQGDFVFGEGGIWTRALSGTEMDEIAEEWLAKWKD